MIWRNHCRALLCLVASVLVAGCGAGVAGVAATSGGSGGGTMPAITDFRVLDPKVSPATLQITTSASVLVALSYERPLAPEVAMTALRDPRVSGNQIQLPVGTTDLVWEFAAEPGLDGARFVRNVELFARHTNGSPIDGGGLLLGMGNDAPRVHTVEPMPTDPQSPAESAGNVEIRLGISDSSSDPVDITVQWRRANDPPSSWNVATAAGVFPVGVETSPEPGVQLSFFWNTNVDLADEEDAVLFRVTADDRTDESAPFETQLPFRVDNNAAPIVQLDSGLLLVNPDGRLGIPIPFRVTDEEADLVQVLFQWRYENGEFPSLPEDSTALDALLADPIERRRKQVCTPYPRFAGGRGMPLDEDSANLPELASSESWILAGDFAGKSLEILRSSQVPLPASPRWVSNPLAAPSAALPVGDGRSALMLDSPGGSWRLREVELATGRVLPAADSILAAGPGLPSALCLELGGAAALVAVDDAGTWRIVRVELVTGASSELFASDGSVPGPVRGIASLGTAALAFTAGSGLYHLDYRDALSPVLVPRLSGLSEPWGLAADLRASGRLFVSERARDRVLEIPLDSLGRLPVVVRTEALQPTTLIAPTALALAEDGTRLLVVTGAPSGTHGLTGIELGAAGGNRAFALGTPGPSEPTSIGTGPAGLCILCFPGADELLVGGGIEQRRTIVAYSPATRSVEVEPPFDPPPGPGFPWRILDESRFVRASATGAAGRFLWDSRDALEGSVHLRAVARDDELGLPAESGAPKRVASTWDPVPTRLKDPLQATDSRAAAIADLDGDGDQDVASVDSGGDDLAVFFQESPARFTETPLVLGGVGVTDEPVWVAAADLDGDGALDLVSANIAGEDLTIFFQLPAGGFSSAQVVGGPTTTRSAAQVLTADLDADGGQDLVSLNAGSVAVFLQESPGSFAPMPIVIGGPGITDFVSYVAVAELEGDGDLDVVAGDDGAAKVFFQLPSGAFSPSPLVLANPDPEGPLGITSVVAADLDRDGDSDLFGANGFGNGDSDDRLFLFLQESAGAFSTPLFVGGGPTMDTPFGTIAADLDQDGDLDLASANNRSDNLTLFHQLAPATFSVAPVVLADPEANLSPAWIAAADIEGDGDMDLLANAGDGLALFLQHSPGSSGTAAPNLGGVGITARPISITCGDIDGDGDLDLASANNFGDDVTAFFQRSPASFAPPLVVGERALSSLVHVAAVDLDGNGNQDLLASGGSGIFAYFQPASGGFPPEPVLLASNSLLAPAVEDFDGDGAPDIALTDPFGNLLWWPQTSPGSYPPAPIRFGNSTVQEFPVGHAPGDLDADGDLDLVSANSASDDLAIFLQLSRGIFSDTPIRIDASPANNRPSAITTGDLDGDGDQDLLCGNTPTLFGNNNLTVFFQLAPASFSPTPLLVGGSGTTRGTNDVLAVDFDGDGCLDLVSANGAGNNLSVFRQTSPGRFGAAPLLLGDAATMLGPMEILAADLDGDGDLDLASANLGSDDLAVFWGGH